MFCRCSLACSLPFKRLKTRNALNNYGLHVVITPLARLIHPLYRLANLAETSGRLPGPYGGRPYRGRPCGGMPEYLRREEIFELKPATLIGIEGCT